MSLGGTFGKTGSMADELELRIDGTYYMAWEKFVMQLGVDPEALAGELGRFGIFWDHDNWQILRFSSVEQRLEFILKWL